MNSLVSPVICSCLLLLLPLLHCGGFALGKPGGWSQIYDLKNPHVVGLAKYAVKTYNERHGEALAFKRLVDGKSQVVAGTNYLLQIEAQNYTDLSRYDALVWEKPWIHFKNLTSFVKL